MASKVMKVSALANDASPDLSDALAAIAEGERLASRAQAAADRATVALDAHRAAMEALEAAPDDPAAQGRLMAEERAAGDAVRHTAALARGADRAVEDHRAVLRAALDAAQGAIAVWCARHAERIERDYQAALVPLVAIVAEAAGFSEAMISARSIVGDVLPGSAMFSVARSMEQGVYSAADKIEVGYLSGRLHPAPSPASVAAADSLAVIAKLKMLVEAKGKPDPAPARGTEPGISGPSATGGYMRAAVSYPDAGVRHDRLIEFVEGSDPSL